VFTFGVNIVKGIHILCTYISNVQNLDHKRVKYSFGIGSLVGVYALGGVSIRHQVLRLNTFPPDYFLLSWCKYCRRCLHLSLSVMP